ncbi:tRNA dihydrouridine synthase DusB [Iamia sp. SCSIO 61187]|uniref:tRNA dihydrouridine synthase DusB n=1 Tax=Iamia sp. SCSIO 61187 TaxID=2722752 RepID=UPI001C6324C7|nr:tRNA dihydrouridine synthase DusB [Iamia sp. SCSIO 61187]
MTAVGTVTRGLRIGPLELDAPVVLAPMAGVTNRAFRRLCRDFGAGLYVSEMITARALVEGNARTLDMVRFDPDERPRSVQLYGVDPGVMAEAVRILVGDHGVEHIDLNVGCPATKVTRKGGGSALPVRRVLFGAIVEASVGAAGPVPFTVKMRMGIDDERLTYLEAARIAEDAGAAAVALHARTAEQLYSGAADWSAITRLKETVTTIPVLGNGDILEGGDAVRMIAETGCDGVVVGRGCLGKPWLFRDLADALAGRPVAPTPRLGEAVAVLRRHADLLVEVFGPVRGAREVRKHTGWYLAGYPVGGEVRRALSQVASIEEMNARLDALDPDLVVQPGSERTVRGHTGGPRRVTVPDGWFARVDDPTPPGRDAEAALSGG